MRYPKGSVGSWYQLRRDPFRNPGHCRQRPALSLPKGRNPVRRPRTWKLELRRHNAHPRHVILRSPALWDDEGSPQFAGNIHPSAHGLAAQRNCGDSSSRQVGTQNDTRPVAQVWRSAGLSPPSPPQGKNSRFRRRRYRRRPSRGRCCARCQWRRACGRSPGRRWRGWWRP